MRFPVTPDRFSTSPAEGLRLGSRTGVNALLWCILSGVVAMSISCNSSNAPDNGIVPNSPLGLTWTTNASSAVVLFWAEVSSSPADGFHVYRKSATTSWVVIGSTPTKTKSYVDSTDKRTTYFYRVTAYNGAGESAPSTSIQINTTLFLNAPTQLNLSNLTPRSLTLTWKDNSVNESGFLVARWAESFGDTVMIDTLRPNSTSFTDTDVVCGTYYRYEVLAYDSAYRSVPTKTIEVAIPFLGLSSQTFEAGVALYAVCAVNGSVGYAAGQHGTVFKTVDGVGWSQLQTGTTKDLQSIYFVNKDVGCAVGVGGTIIRTTNGGNTWTLISSGKSLELNSVWFTSPDSGWIVGVNGIILLSTNGGSSWISRVSNTTRSLYAIKFFDAQHGFAVGSSSTILATNDGGNTWQNQSVTAGLVATFTSISYDTVGSANICGLGGILYHTSDGGTTWGLYYIGATYDLIDASNLSRSDALIVGNLGSVYFSVNGGLSWQRLPYSSSEEFSGAAFAPDGTGFIVGSTGTIIPLSTCNGN